MAEAGYQAQESPTAARSSAPESTPAAGALGPGGLLPAGMGNAAAAELLASQQAPPAPPGAASGPGALGAKVPDAFSLQSAGISFQLPGNTALTGDWNQLQTTRPTRVWITVSRRQLRVSFSPALEVDAQWPLSNVAWSGVTFDFATGRVADVDVENTQIGIPVGGRVQAAVTDFVDRIVRGTRLARGGYDPLVDPDLDGTLRALQAGFTAQGASGGKGGDLVPSQVNGFSMSASLKTRTKVEAGAAGGGLSMPAGASVDLSADLVGNAPTLASGKVPNVSAVHLSSSDLTLQKDGKPVARLRSLRIDRGGTVDVTDFEPLGKLAEIGAGESLIRLLAAVVALQGRDPRLAQNADLNPRVVNGVAEAEIERALTGAIQQLVREHHDVVPGVDLRSVLGVDPNARSTAGPKT